MTLPRMDSRIGLDYIVENREYVSKLGAALDTNNATVKKQVFELLSALCAYNADGYNRAIETLEYYKCLKDERYRLKIVINELDNAINVDYQVTLLAFINCVIISASSLQERIRIRNELIGLKLLPLLNNLRKVAQSVGDIIVQLDVFDEQRECDEAQSLQGPNGINLNSPLDVFYAILRQVADTPQEIPFLSILQHLLGIDAKEPVSDIIWDTTEKLVHRATLLENHEDSVRLLRTPSVQKFTCPHCRSDICSPGRKTSGLPATPSLLQNGPPLSPLTVQPLLAASAALLPSTLVPSAPPAPPLPKNTGAEGGAGAVLCVPPPPPPPQLASNSLCNASVPVPPPAPPPPAPNSGRSNAAMQSIARSRTPEVGQTTDIPLHVLLPQQDTPAPKTKMKTINWGKIPPNKVIGRQNIWTIVANNHQDSRMADIDWNEMEGLFCLQSTSAQGSPKLGRESSATGGCDTLDRKTRKENTAEITLLDGKRSLNVNIFLKQFRTCNEDIIQLIRDGGHDDIGAEKLRGLLKILPEVDELDMLKSFNGDKVRLGNAEKFLLQLLEIPNYKLRIESMLLKEEFAANVGYLDPCINAMIYASNDLLNNKMLQEVLYMVVVAGNFLNSGGYAGNAVGVKLASLQKLTDIRANKPGMNLIHFVALQAEKCNPALLAFTTQMGALESAAKTTSEQISNEINALDGRIRKVKKQIEMPATEADIKAQMLEFLENAEQEVVVLQAAMKQVEEMRLKLAEFFCEDPATFRLEECFRIFHSFCEKFKQAVKENERRQQLEEQATQRRKLREEQLAKRSRHINQCGGTPVSDSENPLLCEAMSEARASPALSRRRMGSFNSNVNVNGAMRNGLVGRMESQDTMSPDITPNGSLRRRRSRILAEEDDLMEFLRSSAGQEPANRDRKASTYGSLDRSWARRARSGSSSRKRPELLNIDFGLDRERANSPSPMLKEQRPQSTMTLAATITTTTTTTTVMPSAAGPAMATSPNEDMKPRISREWRQKIESWLNSNESDDKQSDEYKRKRRLVNSSRRSLENETESERKLDTLPEEKIAPAAAATAANNAAKFHNNNNNCNNNGDNMNEHSINTNANDSCCTTVDGYKRVYTDWKPSKALESADVVGTLQTIADVNCQREKQTPWRRSHLATCDEQREMLSDVGGRQQRPEQLAELAVGCDEEEHRKSYIQQLGEQDASDRLQIYMRRSLDGGIDDNRRQETASSIDDCHAPATMKGIQSAKSHTKESGDTLQSAAATATATGGGLQSPALSNFHRSHSDDADRNVDIASLGCKADERSSSVVTSAAVAGRDSSNCDADLPSYFDRYSLTRRTRRYKRPTDYSADTESGASMSGRNADASGGGGGGVATNEMATVGDSRTTGMDEARSAPSTAGQGGGDGGGHQQRTSVAGRTVAKLEKVGRHISSINQEDVREAIRNLKSPTGTPERIWSPPRDIMLSVGQQGPPHRRTGTDAPTVIKVAHHELNDEGFEETQSLVSDTPSHGKESANSSSNETTTAELQKQPKASTAPPLRPLGGRPMSGRLAAAADRLPTATKMRPSLAGKEAVQGRRPTAAAAVVVSPAERARSVRLRLNARMTAAMAGAPNGPTAAATTTTSALHGAYAANMSMNNMNGRRANTMRKAAQRLPASGSSVTNSPGGQRHVERSSSRNSLRSSRSSINSGASTNTVRRMPVIVSKTPMQTNSVDSSPSKRPLAAQNSTLARQLSSAYRNVINVSVSASRSSSSGSSVGHNVVAVRKTATTAAAAAVAAATAATVTRGRGQVAGGGKLGSSASFKENQQTHAAPPRSAAATLVKTAIAQSNAAAHGGSSNTMASPLQRSSSRSSSAANARVSGFMRPTASSATKRTKSTD